jgi:hypothetical protein
MFSHANETQSFRNGPTARTGGLPIARRAGLSRRRWIGRRYLQAGILRSSTPPAFGITSLSFDRDLADGVRLGTDRCPFIALDPLSDGFVAIRVGAAEAKVVGMTTGFADAAEPAATPVGSDGVAAGRSGVESRW